MYHVMGIMKGDAGPHCVASYEDRSQADTYVHNLRCGVDLYENVWIETEEESRTPLENKVQRQIERELAGE